MCGVFGISDPHPTYHKGYFVLVLGLPPDGENDANAENKQQHEKSKTPRFQPGNGPHSVRGQNAQAQNEKCCEGDTQAKQSQRMHFSQRPQCSRFGRDIKFRTYLLCRILRVFIFIMGSDG